jgi:hypothetical protein
MNFAAFPDPVATAVLTHRVNAWATEKVIEMRVYRQRRANDIT